MFDVRLKGQRPADYLQMVFVEQMDNNYVLGEKQRGDGREVLQEKQYSILFFKWPGTSRENEYIAMFRERARHTVFNLLNHLLKFNFCHARHGNGKYTMKCSLLWTNKQLQG